MSDVELPSSHTQTEANLADVHRSLYESYGPVMDIKALCRVLYYPSADALLEARRRGRVPFTVIRLKGRPGIYAQTAEIAEFLTRSFQEAVLPKAA
jgi:hypothetical protein